MELGEYVRINRDFRIVCIGIGKVVNKSLDSIYVKMSNNDLPISFNVDSISKHSKNIIDLIEAGDYVNGKRVIYVDTIEDGDGNERLCVFVEETQNCIEARNIKTIVTKEQFASMEYKLEAEE